MPAGNWNGGALFVPGWRSTASVLAVSAKMATPASFTSGSAVTLSFTPASGTLLVVCCVSNAYDVSSLSGGGVAAWTKLDGGGLYGGNYAVGSVWFGVVGASPSTSLTITQTGNNQQQYYAFTVVGYGAGLRDQHTVVTNSTTASITPTHGSGITVASYFDRSGALTGPTEGSPWSSLLANYSTGFGQMSVAWRRTVAAATYATFTGRTDNSVEVLGNIY